MTPEQKREHYAEQLIERALMGLEFPEAEDEGDAILRELDQTDPPARVVLTPYVNALGERHAFAEVFTRGSRAVWTLSSHYWDTRSAPNTLSCAHILRIEEALVKCQDSRKQKEFTL